MKSTFNCLSILLCLVLSLNSCKKDGPKIPDPQKDLVKVGEGYALGAGIKIQLWADNNLKTGYNKIYVKAIDSVTQQQKTAVNLKIKPIMTMKMNGMTMQHSSPFESPEMLTNNLFPAAAVFTMPSSADGTWALEVTVNDQARATIPVEVASTPQASTIFVNSSKDNQTYVVSNVQATGYKVGVNDFELQISKKIDGMTYVPANDLMVEITPEMPDMGHGSPNNVNPVLVKNGHYKGKINFTMTGYWKVNLLLKDKAGNLISNDAFFKIIF